MTYTVNITGIERLNSNLGKIDKELFDKVVAEVAKETYNYAKEYAAVDTGELVDSIYHHPISNGWVVGATAKHAVYNEFGSWNIGIGGRISKSGKPCFTPFLRPSAVKALNTAPAKFGVKLRAVWK